MFTVPLENGRKNKQHIKIDMLFFPILLFAIYVEQCKSNNIPEISFLGRLPRATRTILHYFSIFISCFHLFVISLVGSCPRAANIGRVAASLSKKLLFSSLE